MMDDDDWDLLGFELVIGLIVGIISATLWVAYMFILAGCWVIGLSVDDD